MKDIAITVRMTKNWIDNKVMYTVCPYPTTVKLNHAAHRVNAHHVKCV